jgi:hypothetical protein
MSGEFDIYSKIFYRDVGNFFRHLCELVLRHQMRVSNYFVNSFYSVNTNLIIIFMATLVIYRRVTSGSLFISCHTYTHTESYTDNLGGLLAAFCIVLFYPNGNSLCPAQTCSPGLNSFGSNIYRIILWKLNYIIGLNTLLLFLEKFCFTRI